MDTQSPIEENEVELIDYLSTLWKWKGLIVAGTVLFSLTALAISVVLPKTYKATVTLLVAESKIPQPEGEARRADPKISAETFEAMIKNQSLALKVIQHFALDKEPPALTPEQFLQGMIAVQTRRGTNLISLTTFLPDAKLVADVANFVAQEAVALNTRLGQGDTVSARDYIQSQRAQKREEMEEAQATRLNFKRTTNLASLQTEQNILLAEKTRLAKLYLDYGLQRDQTRQMADSGRAALMDFKRTANFASLQAEQNILLAEKKRLADLYSDYTIRLKGLQTTVGELRKALTKHEPLLVVKQSIFSDPVLLAAAQDGEVANLKGLSAIELKSEQINGVYQDLQGNLIEKEASLVSLESQRQDVEQKITDNETKLAQIEQQVAESEARLEELSINYTLSKAAYELFAQKFNEASLESQRQDVEQKVTDTEAKLATVVKQIAETEAQLEELNQNYNLAKAAYALFATKFNEVSLSVASQTTELKIVDPAIVPTKPSGPRVRFNVALACVVGLMVCTLLAFFLEYVQQARQRKILMTQPTQ